MKYQPYINWKIKDLEDKLKNEITNLKTSISNKDQLLILLKLALYDSVWNPITDYDGCTVVQDTTHPDIACFLHDWLFKSRYFTTANNLFNAVMSMQQMKSGKRKRRSFAVRIATIYFRLVNKKNSDVDEIEIKKIIKKIN